MKNYSQLPEAKMAVVRSDLDDVLATVFIESDLPDPRSLGNAYKDTGDGAIIVLPARQVARLVDPLLGHLNDALGRYHRMRLASAPAIRLRASVHVGPLTPDDHRGDAINEACRLVDSQEARQALAAAIANSSFLAAVISEAAFRRTVSAGRTPSLDKRHFLKATARVLSKGGFEQPCRIFVPHVTPAEISLHLTGRKEEASPSQQTFDAQPSENGPTAALKPQSVVKQKAKAKGRARVVQVGGNQITNKGERS
ncbi:hypothetical protein [Streptomyces sp. NBC_00690]|uniref:hypothetical protein n=1 Tax=Streptomyces sp. NBC_00690 TaxID=2975808 RepID=UPI002E2CB043|nr:hypothetical protein [Streptomyces sp. NBC_00690]